MWPFPGYWTPSESDPNVVQCKPPSAVRCTGWSREAGAVKCGSGYDPAVPACGACLPNHYEEDGVCIRCPSGSSSVEVAIVPTIILLTVIALSFGCSFIITLVVFKKNNVPVLKSIVAKIALEFTMWTALSFQLFVQIARLSSPGLPAELRDAYSGLQLLQFDSAGVAPPACDGGGNPFVRHTVVLLVGLVLLLGFVMLSFRRVRHCCCRAKAKTSLMLKLRFLMVQLLVLGFAYFVNTALTIVKCVTVEGNTLAWYPNPFMECYVDDHVFPAALAWALLAGLGLGLPLVFIFVGRRVVRQDTLGVAIAQSQTLTGNGSRTGRSMKSSAEQPSSPPPPPSSPPPGQHPTPCCRCFPAWCRVPQERHEVLQQYPPWKPIFSYGHTWFRSSSMLLMVWLSVLETVFSSPTIEARTARGILSFLSILAIAVVFLITEPDHQWGLWKRFPRFTVSVTTALAAALQVSLAYDDNSNSEAEASRFDILQSANAAPPTNIQPSVLSQILVWAVVTTALLVPIVCALSFIDFVLNILGKRLCPCQRPSPGKATRMQAFLAHFNAASKAAEPAAPATPGKSRKGLIAKQLSAKRRQQRRHRSPATKTHPQVVNPLWRSNTRKGKVAFSNRHITRQSPHDGESF